MYKKNMAKLLVDMIVLIAVLLLSSSSAVHGSSNLYSLTATDFNGEQVALNRYKGKVSLVVNGATECGYTDHNYKQLVQLQSKYSTDIFNVLVFPCNQFGGQEPNPDNKAILHDIDKKYNINFQMFAKVDVLPDSMEQSQVYKYLTSVSGSAPQWNFCKYLVNQEGEVVQYFTHLHDFKEIEQSIEYLTSKAL